MGKNAKTLFLEWLVLKQKGSTLASECTKGKEHAWVLFEGKVLGTLKISGRRGNCICFCYIAEEKDYEPIQKILAFTQYLREQKRLHVSSCSTPRVWERDIQEERAKAATHP